MFWIVRDGKAYIVFGRDDRGRALVGDGMSDRGAPICLVCDDCHWQGLSIEECIKCFAVMGLRAGDIESGTAVILANLAIHRSKEAEAFLREQGCWFGFRCSGKTPHWGLF